MEKKVIYEFDVAKEEEVEEESSRNKKNKENVTTLVKRKLSTKIF